LLNKNQAQRLGTARGVREVLEHPWFADLKVTDVEN